MITLTPRAVEELKDVIQSKGPARTSTRLDENSQLCFCLSYGMMLEEDDNQEGDQYFNQDGINIVIDEFSLKYMDGASVDYVDDGLNSGFKIDNPNAVSGCGCGNSFQTADGQGPGGGCGGCGCR